MKYAEFKEKLNQMLDWREEYETKHDDAGSNYHYLLCESGINAKDVNHWSEDYRYPDKYKLTENDLTDIVRNGDYEMVAGSIFKPTLKENQYYLDSYAVGEIEDQIEPNMFPEVTESTFHRYMKYNTTVDRDECMKRSREYWYAYRNTDAVWYAIHTREIEKDTDTNDNQVNDSDI